MQGSDSMACVIEPLWGFMFCCEKNRIILAKQGPYQSFRIKLAGNILIAQFVPHFIWVKIRQCIPSLLPSESWAQRFLNGRFIFLFAEQSVYLM